MVASAASITATPFGGAGTGSGSSGFSVMPSIRRGCGTSSSGTRLYPNSATSLQLRARLTRESGSNQAVHRTCGQLCGKGGCKGSGRGGFPHSDGIAQIPGREVSLLFSNEIPLADSHGTEKNPPSHCNSRPSYPGVDKFSGAGARSPRPPPAHQEIYRAFQP